MENMRGRGRGRRARGRGRGAIRRKKSFDKKREVLQSAEEDEDKLVDSPVHESPISITNAVVIPSPALDMEADISQLEAPTFTTLSRGPPEPMLRLVWGHSVNLIGEKVLNPMIHCCDTCLRPILIYGRMIPCKHVFCLACAHRDCKQCPRCKDKVLRVEQTGLGTVFMCTHGGSRYGNKGCRRTYLSQRDLQAHINHRHVTGVVQPSANLVPKLEKTSLPAGANSTALFESTKVKLFEEEEGYGTPRAQSDVAPSGIQVSRPPGNLITVPIQEPPPETFFNAFNQPPPAVQHGPPMPIQSQQAMPYFPPTFDYPPPDTSVPPPNQWPGNPPFYG